MADVDLNRLRRLGHGRGRLWVAAAALGPEHERPPVRRDLVDDPRRVDRGRLGRTGDEQREDGGEQEGGHAGTTSEPLSHHSAQVIRVIGGNS